MAASVGAAPGPSYRDGAAGIARSVVTPPVERAPRASASTRARLRSGAVLALLALLPTVVAAPHQGPPVYLQVFVEEDAVRLALTGEQQTVLPWCEVEGPLAPPLAPAVAQELADRGRALIERELRIAVDGARAEPVLQSVAVYDFFGPASGEPSVEWKLTIETDARARRVEIGWNHYPGVDDPTERKMPVVFDAGGEFSFVALTEEEPGFVWHSEASLARPRDARPGAVEALVTVERDTLPLASLLALGAGVLGAALLRRRSAPWLSAGVLAVCGGVALAARDSGRVATPWGSGALPDETQALAVFRTLHEGIYGAFDAKSESEIYDRLARCVDADLVDELYGQVFESLVMREEGGAIAQVEAVDVLEGAVDFPDDATGGALGFDVDWRWRVQGRVIHYGHEHRRSNEYRARYRVAEVDGTWRIASVDVLENRRLPDPEEDA